MKAPELRFSRTVCPPQPTGEPWIIGFADGSLSAYCAILYVRWPYKDNQGEERIHTKIVMAKCRVTPLHGTTIPRSELQAVIILLRITHCLVEAAAFKAQRIVLATDSECAIAALKKPGASLAPFFANRVSEAMELFKRIEEDAKNLSPSSSFRAVSTQPTWGQGGEYLHHS